MKTFEIENIASAVVLGTFQAKTKEAALDMMAADAGYKDYADLVAQVGVDDDVHVTELAGPRRTFYVSKAMASPDDGEIDTYVYEVIARSAEAAISDWKSEYEVRAAYTFKGGDPTAAPVVSETAPGRAV